MDGAIEDRDGLGVDLCLGRRLGPLLRKRHNPTAVITQQLATPSANLLMRYHQLGCAAWWTAVS